MSVAGRTPSVACATLRRCSRSAGARVSVNLVASPVLPVNRDPALWRVQCKQGQENEACVQLMRRFFERQGTDEPLLIKSALANPVAGNGKQQKSYIYIEAYKQAHVKEAIKGLAALQYGQYSQARMRNQDQESCLRVVRKQPLKEGSWVRMKSTLYKDDIARVARVEMSRNQVELRIVPRIDYDRFDSEARKRKRRGLRPPPKLFDADRCEAMGLDVSPEDDHGSRQFDNKTFFGGFLSLIVPMSKVDSFNVKPTLDELRTFESAELNGERLPDALDGINQSSNPFAIGDKVEVIEGELMNLIGTVTKVEGSTVRIMPAHEDLDEELDLQASELSKCFRTSDHVKVIEGRFQGESGLVVRVGRDAITLVSDMSRKEIQVRPQDIKLAIGESTGQTILGKFEVQDLVMLDPRTAGCIVQIERNQLYVLDHNGQKRQVKPNQVEPRRFNRGSALDMDQNEIAKDSVIKVRDGPHKGKDGKVLHVYRSFLFVYKREILEDSGVFVCRSKHAVISGSGVKRTGLDSYGSAAVPMSPRIHDDGGRGRGGARGDSGRGRGGKGRKHELLYKSVRIVSGTEKGYIGIVKDATATHARVEIHATYKTKMIELKRLKPIADSRVTQSYPSGTMQFTGQRTPAYGGQTPMHGSQTPMHGGSQTPAYGAQTPRYGGSTPAHDGSRTPGRGDMTPGYSGSAWDPKLPSTPAETPWEGAATPGEYNDGSTYGESPYPESVSGPPSVAPATPGNPATPADTYEYDEYTPKDTYAAGTPGEYSAYGDNTPGGATPGATPGDPSTPGDAYTPSTPNGYTPSGTPGEAYTPTSGTPSGSYTPAEGSLAWICPGIYAKTQAVSGVVVNVGGETCTLRQASGEEAQVPKVHLQPVRPDTKSETVKVLRKEYRGHIGTVLNFDRMEAIVRLKNADEGEESLVRILEKDILVKFDENFQSF